MGAKTWRPKTADQSYLELERRKYAEEAERKQAEVKQKIEMVNSIRDLLNEVRKLEAKTQALNEMALSAEIQTKEHELAMRERQAAESRQMELAKLELAKRMGQESLNEADFARIRRQRMQAELLARASNNRAMEEIGRSLSRSEINEPMSNQMPPPPSFTQSDRIRMQTPNKSSMPGPIPIPGPYPMSDRMMPYPMSVPSPPFTRGHSSMGGLYLPHPGLHPTYDHPDEMPIMPPRLRRMSDSLGAHPAHLGPGEWTSFKGGFAEPGPFLSDYHDIHRASSDFRDPRESVAVQMALRAQAERLRRKRLEKLDLNARQQSLNIQALRELRLRDLRFRLRERGMQQREVEAQLAQLAERDACLNEAQLRELREREYRLELKEKGLQEREIAEQWRRREAVDRELLHKEMARLERDLRLKEVRDAERAICRAQEKGETPPMGVKRPTREEIAREGLLDDLWFEFQDLNPRLRQEILSMSAHYNPRTSGNTPRPQFSSMNNMNQANSARPPTCKTPEGILKQTGNPTDSFPSSRARNDSTRPASRPTSRVHEHESTSRPLSRCNSARQSNSPSRSRLGMPGRPPSRGLGIEDPSINLNLDQRLPLHESESRTIQNLSSHSDSFNDDTLSARLQSAAVNSEINGGRRSRASTYATQASDHYLPTSRRWDGNCSPLNPNVGGRPWDGTVNEQTEAEIFRGGQNSLNADPPSGQRSRSNSTTQLYGTSPQPRMASGHQINRGIGQPSMSNDGDYATRGEMNMTRNSRPSSQAGMPGSNHVQRNYNILSDEELSQLDTAQLEILLAGRDMDHSLFQNNASNIGDLTNEEINQLSSEQLDALFSRGNLTSDVSNARASSSQSHRTNARPQSFSTRVSPPSSQWHGQCSINQGPVDSARPISRGGTSSSRHSSQDHRNSRDSGHAVSLVREANSSSPRNSRSLYTMPDHDLSTYKSQQADAYNDSDGRQLNSAQTHHLEGNLIDSDFLITEMPELEGTQIVERLGGLTSNSRYHPSDGIDTNQVESSEQSQMHRATKNLIAEASRLGANAIVSLRIHDLDDGSCVARGEAVVLTFT